MSRLFLSRNIEDGNGRAGYTKCVHTLLEQGEANVNAQNKVGNTPLSMAVFKGHRDTAECLMKHGASAALKDSKGRSALDYAHPRQNPDPGESKRLVVESPWVTAHQYMPAVLTPTATQ